MASTAKKATKPTPHLRIRMAPRLLSKLEKAREKGGHTLTGEITDRLIQSFDTEDRNAILRNQVMIMQALRLIIKNQIGDLGMVFDIEARIDNTQRYLEGSL